MKYLELMTQKRRFQKLESIFSQTYEALQSIGKEPFIMPFWAGVNKKVEPTFLPKPKLDFLSDQALRDTMFVAGSEEWIKAQTDYVKDKLGRKFRRVLQEDPVGKPAKFQGNLSFTSHNTLHHMYHILFYLDQTQQSISDIPSIVEWGGGYGNFAKLWWRIKESEVTYTIIDTALFCTIQWLYLTSVLGSNSVNLLKSSTDKIQPGKINIVPLALLDKVPIQGDLFVSTWGLSESMASAQDYVIDEKGWFGAKHLLVGFQDSTADLKHASRLGELAKKDGAKIIDIKFIPNNHYAIK
jgi:hypothetical protein